MSIASQIAAAATEAQGVLAQVGGALPDATNSLYNGKPYLAVYGTPQVQNQIMPGGGYRQRTFLSMTATKDQFSAIPEAKKKWTRTDIMPALTYTIDSVGTHDANLYTLVLFRPGE